MGFSEDEKFDGKQSNYFAFITDYETKVSRIEDPAIKLTCLRKWTKGDAKRHPKWIPKSTFDRKGDFAKSMLLLW